MKRKVCFIFSAVLVLGILFGQIAFAAPKSSGITYKEITPQELKDGIVLPQIVTYTTKYYGPATKTVSLSWANTTYKIGYSLPVRLAYDTGVIDYPWTGDAVYAPTLIVTYSGLGTSHHQNVVSDASHYYWIVYNGKNIGIRAEIVVYYYAYLDANPDQTNEGYLYYDNSYYFN